MNYSVSVLTLYGETERQNKISKNLNSSGIDFEFFSVNKNDLICFPRFTYAETGCTISHMLMTEEFIRTKKEFKVILEDDAMPTEKFKSTLGGNHSHLAFKLNVVKIGSFFKKREKEF